MTLDKLLDYINLILNKEQKGNVLKPTRFNTSLQAANITLFEREYQRAGETAAQKIKPLYDILMSNRAMKRFVHKQDLVIDDGFGTLSSLTYTFREQLKAGAYVGTERFKCDFVSEEMLERFRFSLLETPKTDEFAAVVRGSAVAIYPNNVTKIELVYLREPALAVYDYCLGAQTDREYYMPPGSLITGGNLKQGGVILQSDVISKTGLTTGYNSTSVELDWDTSMHIAFANEILLMLGVNLQDQLALQHAQNERMIK